MATIYKRGKVYWGRVQRAGREHRQSLETTARAVAEKRLKDWLKRLEAASWGDAPARTFDEAMLNFLDRHVPTLKPTSQRRYMISAKMMTPFLEGLGLHEITHGKLSEFETNRRRDGASGPTIRRDLACLSSMWETAATDWDMEMPNPVPGYLKKRRKRGLKESPPRTRYLSHDEQARLLDGAGDYLRPIIAFAIETGLRLEEQLSLTRDQVSHNRREITLTKTKNGHKRVVPMTDGALIVSARLPAHIRPPHYLFAKADGSRYGKLTRGLAGAAKRAGIRDLKWHDLRRTCGCRLLQDYAMPIEQVSRWLGHKSIAQTERAYAFLEVDQLHRTIAAGTISGTGRAD